MKLLSVNIGQAGTVQRKDYREKTGIFKLPTDQAVQIGALGLAGDVILSEKHHGGVDQAVYIYGDADYDWWRNELGRELAAGIFGENLTISDLESATFAIGDILHVGEVTLQVTAPRIPCKTFAARMEDPQFVKKFRAAERPGLYCRVLKEGSVQVDNAVRVEKYTESTVTLLDCYRDFYEPDLREAAIRRFLEAPIAIRMRTEKEEQLVKVLENGDNFHEKLLRRAIEIAANARAHGNHPFGALLADAKGNILLEAENTVNTERDATGHAETNLMRLASQKYSEEELKDFTLYTSTEPCPMCAGAIFWGYVGRVVFALSQAGLYKITGETPYELALPCREVFARGTHPINVVGPLIEEAASKVHFGFWDA